MVGFECKSGWWWRGWWIEKGMMVGGSQIFMNMQHPPLYLMVLQHQLVLYFGHTLFHTTPLLLFCLQSLSFYFCLFDWRSYMQKRLNILWWILKKLPSIKGASVIIEQGQRPASALCLKWFNDAAFVQKSCRDQKKTIFAQGFTEETGDS